MERKDKKFKQVEEALIFKVTLNDCFDRVKNKPYRTLIIPKKFTLYNLAKAITDSFDFYFNHCFGFYDNLKRWTKSKEGYELFADIGEGSEFEGVKKKQK